MQHDGTMRTGIMQRDASLWARFLSKIVVDVLPAAGASVIGGFLITQYQFGHNAALRPAAEQVAPASLEMMQLVHDEHAMIVNYLKTQTAAEKTRHAEEDEAVARAVADAKVALDATALAPAPSVTATPARAVAAVAVASKPVAPRGKVAAVVVLPPHAPLVIAQAEQNASAAPAEGVARAPRSLLARTIDIKDHVVHATFHVVSAIGGIPSWIASWGDRSGDADATSDAAGRSFMTPS